MFKYDDDDLIVGLTTGAMVIPFENIVVILMIKIHIIFIFPVWHVLS